MYLFLGGLISTLPFILNQSVDPRCRIISTLELKFVLFYIPQVIDNFNIRWKTHRHMKRPLRTYPKYSKGVCRCWNFSTLEKGPSTQSEGSERVYPRDGPSLRSGLRMTQLNDSRTQPLVLGVRLGFRFRLPHSPTSLGPTSSHRSLYLGERFPSTEWKRSHSKTVRRHVG